LIRQRHNRQNVLRRTSSQRTTREQHPLCTARTHPPRDIGAAV
jgi:hypothetical protein